MTIEQFVLKGPLVYPLIGRALDYKKLIAASDEVFARFYLELMEEYKHKNGWWSVIRSLNVQNAMKSSLSQHN
jgi:hypothetical protein